MKGRWQVVMVIILVVVLPVAADPPKPIPWDAPVVVKSMFTPDLGMLDSERDEYATNLSILAANQVAKSQASPQALAEARRLLGLALQLSPRNKRALVTNYQLTKGVMPEVTGGNYSPQVFGRLLLTRGQVLERQGGEENKRLARYFIHLAAILDPKNEDAVYASEVQRLDHGEIDWSVVTNGPPPDTGRKNP